MFITRVNLLLSLLMLPLIGTGVTGKEITVSTSDELRTALQRISPGDRLVLDGDRYRGDLYQNNLQGTKQKPIVISGADPDDPPVIRGKKQSLHLVNPAYVQLRNLVLDGGSSNGLNIDDGGDFSTPAHHIRLENLVVRNVGPNGNRDGIKLSGVTDFVVQNCRITNWGDGGSAVDLVGCHRGRIKQCRFQHKSATSTATGVQIKGGSTKVVVRACRFDNAGRRAVNIGGSTGIKYFRPKPKGYEAKQITVEGCLFTGSNAAVAFVGVDGATVRYNTIYRPRRWVFRILQETRKKGFVPSRKGRFFRNLIVFRSGELARAVNVGSGTAPETFTIRENFWYCADRPERSKPENLPVAEKQGMYGNPPHFRDPDEGKFAVPRSSPARSYGSSGFHSDR